jgi:GNAT superfamily N-acetyltransferase
MKRRTPPVTEPLSDAHDPSKFDSGAEALDDWLRNYALGAQRSYAARVYVIHERGEILGFYALSAGSVRPEQAPERVKKGQGRYDLPLVVLTRLGVDRRLQGKGVGAALLKDALLRVDAAADIVGVRAVHAHAKHVDARGFYAHFGFEPSPIDEFAMYLLMKDLRANIG